MRLALADLIKLAIGHILSSFFLSSFFLRPTPTLITRKLSDISCSFFSRSL
jgi:hypothetical protein